MSDIILFIIYFIYNKKQRKILILATRRIRKKIKNWKKKQNKGYKTKINKFECINWIYKYRLKVFVK